MRKILLAFILVPCMLLGQGIPTFRTYKKKVAIGVFDHSEAILPTMYFEFCILPRLTLEPQLGMLFVHHHKYLPNPGQDVLYRRFGVALGMHYYFLLNHRYPMEGIFAAIQVGTYRSNSIALQDRYMPYRNFQVYEGAGLGGNYYFLPQFSLGGCMHIAYTAGTDYLFRPDGSIFVREDRSGFVLTFGLQAGFSF